MFRAQVERSDGKSSGLGIALALGVSSAQGPINIFDSIPASSRAGIMEAIKIQPSPAAPSLAESTSTFSFGLSSNPFKTPYPPQPLLNQPPPMLNQLPPMLNQPPPMLNHPPPLLNQPPPMLNQLPPMLNQPPPMLNPFMQPMLNQSLLSKLTFGAAPPNFPLLNYGYNPYAAFPGGMLGPGMLGPFMGNGNASMTRPARAKAPQRTIPEAQETAILEAFELVKTAIEANKGYEAGIRLATLAGGVGRHLLTIVTELSKDKKLAPFVESYWKALSAEIPMKVLQDAQEADSEAFAGAPWLGDLNTLISKMMSAKGSGTRTPATRTSSSDTLSPKTNSVLTCVRQYPKVDDVTRTEATQKLEEIALNVEDGGQEFRKIVSKNALLQPRKVNEVVKKSKEIIERSNRVVEAASALHTFVSRILNAAVTATPNAAEPTNVPTNPNEFVLGSTEESNFGELWRDAVVSGIKEAWASNPLAKHFLKTVNYALVAD